MKDQNRILIGITGKMGAGKTTVSKIIAQQLKEANVLQIAGSLKKIIRELNLPYKREVLQETGDFFRKWDKLVWVKSVLREAHKLQDKEKGTVIDDIRYIVERDELKKNFFWIIRVNTDEKTRRSRLALRDNIVITDELWASWANHLTESEVSQIDVDFEIDNNVSYNKLSEKIIQILNIIYTN